MAYVDIVTVLAVLQFLVFGFQVGGARGKYGVKAPATTGNEIFERVFRIQQNTTSSAGKSMRRPTSRTPPSAVSDTA